ncbi:MAG: hypothetical protein JRM80_01815 [Nitrososphaerota archaeon]|nr:hypothetical protein [Nitrososphaerota archaeon]
MPPHRRKTRTLPLSMVNCMICPLRLECIRCSSLSQVDPKHPERLRDLVVRNIYRMEPTPEDQARMDAGTAAHMELEERRQVDTDPASIIRRIKNKETFYFSLSFCSVRYGLRGTVDAVLVDWQGSTLRLMIIDDKTHLSSPIFKQLWAYGMILSDPNCLYTRQLDGEGEEIERKNFYQDLGDIFDSVEVWTTINPYMSKGQIVDRPIPARPFSRARVFVDKGLVFAVLRSKRKLLDAYSEPEILAATQQMKFKRSGNQLVLYEPEQRR